MSWTAEQDAEFRAAADGSGEGFAPPKGALRPAREGEQDDQLVELTADAGATATDAGWLAGAPMDPAATSPDPLPALPGFPFLHKGSGAVIVGPTGGGRSSLVEACAYDAAKAGVRTAYLGSEVTEGEFNARAAVFADRRGDEVGDELRGRLAPARYLDLAPTIMRAWASPEAWVAGIVAGYDVVIIDPLSSVASALDLNFDNANVEFVGFYDKLVQPLVTVGVTVVLVDNVGHAFEAKKRAKGVSAKSDRADLTFSCALVGSPAGLVVKAQKVRSVRSAARHGDEWLFLRDSQQLERRVTGEVKPDGAFRPTLLMERASVVIEQEPGLSKAAARRQVEGTARHVDTAVERLISERYVEAVEHGQAHLLRSLRPYRQADDPPTASDRVGTASDRVADAVKPTASTASGSKETRSPDAVGGSADAPTASAADPTRFNGSEAALATAEQEALLERLRDESEVGAELELIDEQTSSWYRGDR